jgi:hypothetical protein
MKSMMAMQGIGETMLDMNQKSNVLEEGSQKMVMKRADKFKVILNTCLDMVEDHFKKFADILELKMESYESIKHSPGECSRVLDPFLEGGANDVCGKKNPCTDGFHQ